MFFAFLHYLQYQKLPEKVLYITQMYLHGAYPVYWNSLLYGQCCAELDIV